MIPRRDTYHDLISFEEMEDCRSQTALDVVTRWRVSRLLDRSGARQVASALLHVYAGMRVRQFSVSFDSAAWTGRPA